MLNDHLRRKLLEIARRSIQGYLKEARIPAFSVADPELTEKGAAFVTLTKGGHLRGCIGVTEAVHPLYQTISSCAVSAAFSDPRFLPLARRELPQIRIEISVLTPLTKIEGIEEIEVGRHGLFITKGLHHGLLLPQVAVEYGWDRQTFLEETCGKAGLPADGWKSGADIYIFSAEVFHE